MSLLAMLAGGTNPKLCAPTQPDLERMLLDLTAYGLPRVSKHKSGWYASIEMSTNAIGAKFEVASDFANESPRAAVAQLTERVLAAVAAIGGPR